MTPEPAVAMFAGFCERCDGDINVGDPIWRRFDDQIICYECARKGALTQ